MSIKISDTAYQISYIAYKISKWTYKILFRKDMNIYKIFDILNSINSKRACWQAV